MNILPLLMLIFILGCEDKPAAPVATPPLNLSVTPGALEITILSPATDGNSVSSYTSLSGECGIPGNPIVVTGAGKTIYSICQNDYTWLTTISAASQVEGTVQYSATLKDKLLASSSTPALRSFLKRDGICLDPANLAKLYANSGVGDGDAVPYKICTPTQFSNIKFNPTKKFQIAQDIDFSETIVAPLAPVFTGTLDGQGFLLRNFEIRDVGGTGISVGLFKYVQGATIKNLNLKNVGVDASQRVGIIAGDWRGGGLIENVKVQGSVKAVTMAGGLIGLGNTNFALTIKDTKTEINVTANAYTGGVIGLINTNTGSFTITNSQFKNDVTGDSFIGGIAGQILERNTTFTNVTHRGNVSSFKERVGGLVGELSGGTLTNVTHIGTVGTSKDAVDTLVGGLIGVTTGPVTINGATVVSTIAAGGNYTGGLVGRFYSGSVTNAVARVTLNVEDNYYFGSQKFVGGLLGATNLDTTITDSHVVGALNAKAYYVGGLVGNMNGAASSIQRSWITGTIDAKVSHVGGLVGLFLGNSITQSFSRANITITGPTPNAFIGGVVGNVNNPLATFTRLYNSGNITVMDGTPDNVGGIFGYVRALSVKQVYSSGDIDGPRSKVGGVAGYLWAPLSESFFSGTITAKLRYVGGLAGVSYQSTLTDNFVKSAKIQGSGEVGGIVGWMVEGNSANINRTYFSGGLRKNATSSLDDSSFGSIVGLKDPNTTLNNSIYDNTSTFIKESDSSNIVKNSLGLPLTPAVMHAPSGYANFNFTDSPTAYNWVMPNTGYRLPQRPTDHTLAKHDWLNELNQGFVLPVTYTDNPVTEPQPPMYDATLSTIGSFPQDEIDVIQSTTPPTTVTQGQTQISFISPETNGAPISGKLLVHGECGIPGAKIAITGSFTMSSVCQTNYRWASVVDATSKPNGTLTLNVSISNLAQTTTSAQVSRTLLKGSSICSDPLSIRGVFANSHLGGNGTTVPFQICHIGHFKNLAYNPTANVELASDIDFGNNSIDPIGAPFKGTFDGKGFSLRNIIINKPSSISVGLFAAVHDATFKNLIINKFVVTGSDRVGVIAGDWRGIGIIENVSFFNGTINALQNVGALAGIANTASALDIRTLKMTNVTVNANNNAAGVIGHISSADGSFSAIDTTLTKLTVNGLNNVGGLTGISLQPNHVVTNLVATELKVTALGAKVGGVFGNIHSATMSTVDVSGEVNAPKDAVEVSGGGIVGEATTALTLSNVKWTGAVNSGSDNIGGIGGKITNLTATNLISSGVINLSDDRLNTVRKNVGGLFGLIQGETSSVINSYSTMTLNADAQYAGGLFGRFEGEFSVIKDCYFSGTLTARTSFVGGLAGVFSGKDLWDSYSTAAVNVSTPTPNAHIGGLVGYANSLASNYKRLRSTGNVTITNGSADYVGGLIGFFRAGSLEDSHATGNVTGARISTGGLVGMMRGSIDRCFSTGNVSVSGRHSAGLVGYLNLNGYIRDSFTTGNVTGNDETGGLVGYVNTTHGQVAVQRSYAFGQVNKLQGSIAPDSNFGPIYGAAVTAPQVDTASTFFLTSNHNLAHNNFGTGVASSASSQTGSFPGLNFSSTPGWRIPAPTTIVPGYGPNFPYPILSWIGAGSSTNSYRISGSVAGLQYGSVTVSLNGGQESVVVNTPNTTFSFLQEIMPGQSYDVTITSQPTAPALTCTIANGSGTISNSNITNVSVTCPIFQSIAVTVNAMMGVGSTQPVSVMGTLSNSVQVDVTANATLASSNTTNFSLTGTTLSALSAGATTISSTFHSLSNSKTVTVYDPPAAPTAAVWQGTSPSAVTALTARWTASATSGITSQVINYYSTATCTGSPVTTRNLTAAAVSDAFTGTDALTYSYQVTAVHLSSLTATSACSNSMLVTLPTPSPITALAASDAWVRGALPVSSPIFSWTNPANITHQEVALGNTAGGTQIVNWTSTGSVVTSYAFNNLSTLLNCTPYYASFRTVNQYNKKSTIVTHATGFRLDNGAPSIPGSVTTSGSASSGSATIATWGASSDNCQLNSYELAIGTTAGGSDISGGWKNIGNVTTYQPTSGAAGFSFTLAAATDYFTSIRAKDQAGNYSVVSTSTAWRLPTTSLAKLFWFDGSDQTTVRDPAGKGADEVGFTGFVRTWQDKSTTGIYDAYSSATAQDPKYVKNENAVTFSGVTKYLRLPTNAAFDNATLNQRNIFVTFRTSSDVTAKQVVYEQGNNTRGLNLYLMNGKMYCGFWNNANNGDGTQALLNTVSATSLTANTTYHAALVYDYTNYTSATGPNGSIKCYLNNNQFGSTLSTTSRLFAHSNSAALGASYAGTYYHDGSVTTTSSFLKGSILEAIMFSAVPTAAEISSTFSSLMAKWSSGELSGPSNLALVNNSTLTKGATASWTAFSNPYFITDHYEIGIGTTEDDTDVLDWINIGNVTRYTPTAVTLAYSTDYYIHLKAVDVYGNVSQIAVSEAWRVFPAGSSLLAGTFLNLDASNFASIIDGAGLTALQTGFANIVAQWQNTASASINNFTQATSANRPTFDPYLQSAYFNGTNKFMSSPSETNISASTVTAKILTMVFSTNVDVTTRQFLFELGDRTKSGIGIYIEGGQLYCLFHQSQSGGDGVQAPIWNSTPIVESSSYVVSLYLDYTNYTTTTGPNGTVGCVVNGVALGSNATTSRWYSVNQISYLGYRNNAKWHNNNNGGVGDYFSGEMHEVQMTNTWPTNGVTGIQNLQMSLMNKW